MDGSLISTQISRRLLGLPVESEAVMINSVWLLLAHIDSYECFQTWNWQEDAQAESIGKKPVRARTYSRWATVTKWKIKICIVSFDVQEDMQAESPDKKPVGVCNPISGPWLRIERNTPIHSFTITYNFLELVKKSHRSRWRVRKNCQIRL